MRRGEKRKRWALGTLVIVWTSLAFIDYATSTGFPLGSFSFNEVAAVKTLRLLVTAENSFSDKARTKGIPEPTFATIRELRENHQVNDDLTDGKPHNGYRFGEAADPTKKTFLFYAVPAYYPQNQPRWSFFVPGAALWFDGWRHDETKGTGARIFSVDESGAIRGTNGTIPPPLAPVTREQAAQWPLI